MRKEQRKILEELSLKDFGNKNYYRKIEKSGILYRDPQGAQCARIRLTDDGLIAYIEKTIKAREDFKKGLEAIQQPEGDDEPNTTTNT
jgi:hypothetical protein